MISNLKRFPFIDIHDREEAVRTPYTVIGGNAYNKQISDVRTTPDWLSKSTILWFWGNQKEWSSGPLPIQRMHII